MTEENIHIVNPEFLKVPAANTRVVQRASDLSTWLRYNATSANSSAINFVFTAPSTAALLSEKVLLAFNSVAVDFVFTNTGLPVASPVGGLFPGNGFSLRDFPIHRIFNSASITIANSTMSIPLNDILSAYRYCAYDANDQVDLGSLYGAKDELAGHYPNPTTTTGSSLINAIGNVNSQNIVSASHRGMLGIEKIVVNNGSTLNNAPYAGNENLITGNTTFTVFFSISELLMLPIFSFIKKEGISLTHISQIQLSFVLASTSSMFSYYYGDISPAASTTLTAVQMNSANGLSPSNCVLSMQWYTAPAGQDYDKPITRNYLDLQRYITSVTANVDTNPAQGTQRFSSQTISLPCIPSKLLVWLCSPRGFKQTIPAMGYNDAFASIRKAYVTLGARSNLLASADRHLCQQKVF
jgi:hypothetical protein